MDVRLSSHGNNYETGRYPASSLKIRGIEYKIIADCGMLEEAVEIVVGRFSRRANREFCFDLAEIVNDSVLPVPRVLIDSCNRVPDRARCLLTPWFAVVHAIGIGGVRLGLSERLVNRALDVVSYAYVPMGKGTK